MITTKKSGPGLLLKTGLVGLIISVLSAGAMAQRGSMTESGKPAAHAGQQPINNLPNPYVTERNFGSLPDGRSWGSVSAMNVDIDGVHIWVGDRCGTNQCATTPDINPIVKLDPNGRVVAQFGAGQILWPHGMDVDSEGNITTLGRGGSDTTAVALAVALEADECQIYTDVDGVYTTDPRMVPEARHIPKLALEEMLEMASQGSKVLQIRAVEFAHKYNMPIRVLSSFDEGDDGKSTLVTREEDIMEEVLVRGVAFNKDEAQLTITGVPDQPGVAFKILGDISEANIEIDMIVQNIGKDGTTDFTFTVHRNEYEQAMTILKATGEKLGAKNVSGDDKIAKVSIIGGGMRSHAGVATDMFKALAHENINIHMISTSEIKVSVVVDEKYLELAVRSLHETFDLDKA